MPDESVKRCGEPNGCRWYIPGRPYCCDDVCRSPKAAMDRPAYERTANGACGPDGKNWEPKKVNYENPFD